MEPITTLISAITGIGGGLVTALMKYKNKKLDIQLQQENLSYQLQRDELNIEAEKARADNMINVTHAQVDGEIQKREIEAFKSSQQVQKKTVFKANYMDHLHKGGKISKWVAAGLSALFGLVDVVRFSIRSFTTIYLLGLSTWLTYRAYDILSKADVAMPIEDAIQIWNRSVDTVFYLTVMCVSWWFASRTIPNRVNKDKH